MKKKRKYIFVIVMLIITLLSGRVNATSYGGQSGNVASDPDMQFYQELEAYFDDYGKYDGYKGMSLEAIITEIDRLKNKIGGVGQGSFDGNTQNNVNKYTELQNKVKKEKKEQDGEISDEDYLNYTYEQIVEYMKYSWGEGTEFPLSDEIKEKWEKTLNAGTTNTMEDMKKKQYIERLNNNNKSSTYDKWEEEPGESEGILGQSNAGASHTTDEIIKDGQDFLNQATKDTINGENLEDASSTLYNILLSIGIFVAIAIGMYLGAKFMMASAGDRAKVKESLIPYIAGCIVIFTGFAIWKIVILLIRGIA